ncbi:MAG: DUF1189 family protein [Elusimicrobia bacterium]|nr:DUF1189 family protein [Elusimicrobiota bacterium]
MVLEPLSSVASLAFYREVAKKSLGRVFLYLCYLSLLFSLAATVAFKVKVGPAIDDTFQWLASSTPPLTFEGGKLSSTAPQPLTIRHPKIPEIAVTIDTARAEPVTPETLAAGKVSAYLTANALYIMKNRGQLAVHDFSTAVSPKPVVIGPAFFREAQQALSRFLYPIVFAGIFLLFLAWKAWATLLYSLLALLFNAAAGTNLSYRSLLGICVYAQTLAAGLQAAWFFLPVAPPYFFLAGLALNSTYILLAVLKNREPAVPMQNV